ncbi:phosphoserine aminotransferase [Neolewinella xylanilytica]|uniref:Phosphoserine aminotransferase n=1 Tax=Neolewinella xylanilytica TaxID=1514080 RepID=A0A2S6I0E9_9BACT|nr:3-phosphoserine/phosphohydroxythreonine transaminase [Neolewinella xylanilytica]PPK84343.1 phosphoserine aminotransferase [Neolewinella xylanilytica]
MKKINFSAGPAILPASVLEEAADAVRDLNNSGLSILEISHRSKAFSQVLLETESLVRELMGVGEEYAVLFLSGGASTQFFYTAMNLLNPEETAGFLDTGAWSAKAIKETKLFGKVNVLASSKESNYDHIPRSYTIPEGLKYLHVTSNNTIFGTQIHEWPETSTPLVADMSSDIFSRRIPLEKFGIIYAGAQKNLGPAGVTLVIVKKDLLGTVERALPSMLDYRVHIKGASTYNTPPVYPIYVMMLTLRWIKEQGGLEAMEKHNEKKAKLLYDEIDRNPKFKGTVSDKESRSLMNVTFVCTDEADTERFQKEATEAGCDGVKGHRSVGGFRASIYNSMPYEGVETLVNVMKDF